MFKLFNKRGQLILPEIVALSLVGALVFGGHIAYKNGKVGSCGTWNHATTAQTKYDIVNMTPVDYTYPECTQVKVSEIDLSQAKVVRMAKADFPFLFSEGIKDRMMGDIYISNNDFSKGIKAEQKSQSYIR